MIRANQLAAALYGTWLILKLDPRGFAYFEKTPGGFARSFIAAAITAPFQLAHVLLIYPQARTKLGFAPFMIVQMLWFVLAWVSFPFVMLYIADLLHRRDRYFWQMVPYNWVQLASALPSLILLLLFDVHAISSDQFGLMNTVPLLISFVYGVFTARAGLQIALGAAFGVAILDQLLGVFLSEVINRI